MIEVAHALAQPALSSHDLIMAIVTGMQLRMARAGLNISQQDAAAGGAVSVATLRRIELQDGVPKVGAQILWRLENLYRAAGAEFIPDGVRIRRIER